MFIYGMVNHLQINIYAGKNNKTNHQIAMLQECVLGKSSFASKLKFLLKSEL